MNFILSNEHFNASNMTLEFYLVRNRFAQTGFIAGELESNKNHGEPHLVYHVNRCKIYVMNWSEVFAEFDMRHSYINEKLQLEQNKLQKEYSSANQLVLIRVIGFGTV